MRDPSAPGPRRILFISHDASRTGAPLLLLRLLRHYKELDCFEFDVLLRNGGELFRTFAEVADIHQFQVPPMPQDPPGHPVWKKIAKWCLQLIGLRPIWTAEKWKRTVHQSLLKELEARAFELVYANTIACGDVLELVAELGLPIITHAHELETVIESKGTRNWDFVAKNTDHFIAASEAVKLNLIIRRGVPKDKVSTVHEFIDTTAFSCREQTSARIRTELGIPQDAFVVCGSGTDAWRKGTDLFVELAGKCQSGSGHGELFFIWVGGWRSAEERLRIINLARQRSVDRLIRFTGAVTMPQDYFCAADVFAMVSREDPFPLVCLEAAALGKPILCFRDAGGMPEFVEDDAGFCVPFLDVKAMADAIKRFQADNNLLADMGRAAQAKVIARHDLKISAERIAGIIKRTTEKHATKSALAGVPASKGLGSVS